MKKSNMLMMVLSLLIGATTWAAPTVKYTGTFSIQAAGAHNATLTGDMKLTFDGEQLTSVYVKPSKPIFGFAEFTSKEQYAFSNTASNPPQMAVIFKLKGPPHTWYYVFLFETKDEGKTFSGTVYKGDKTVEDIKKALDAGTMNTFKTEGTASLVAVPGIE